MTEPVGSGRGGAMADAMRRWLPVALIVGMAALLRLPWLDLRPLHHDEGSNAIFIERILHGGSYRYDPANYHGPLLFRSSALALRLFGSTTVAFRIVPALIGTLMVALILGLRRPLGIAGARVAALLVALSPSFVYYSRDNIHEIYFAGLTLLLVSALVGWRTQWGVGRAVLAGLSAGGLVATKESAILVFAALAAGLLLSGGAGILRIKPVHLATVVVLAIASSAWLYDGTLPDPRAMSGPLRSILLWAERGLAASGHVKPWWYFLRVMTFEEPAIVAAAVAGGVIGVRRRDRFAVFLAGWTGCSLVIHSAIPYKTPWLVLNPLLPMALLAGRLASFLGTRPGLPWVRPGRALLVMLLSFSLVRAIDLSFVSYDRDGRSDLIYVQTRRDALRLVDGVERYASGHGCGPDMPVDIVSPDYLPLNWYLRGFSDVSYHGAAIDAADAPIIVARSDDAPAMAARLGADYDQQTFVLRPGVDLVLFTSRRADEACRRGGTPVESPAEARE